MGPMDSPQVGAYWSLWPDCVHASLRVERQATCNPAYYNYVCALLLLNGISLFGCFLVASGFGFGLWLYNITTVLSFSLPSTSVCDFPSRLFPGGRYAPRECILLRDERWWVLRC